MRVIVTGGAGFMGSWIAEALCDAGHEVHIIDDLSGGFTENIPDNADASIFDLRDAQKTEEVFGRLGPETVYHLACHPHEGLSQFMPMEISSSVLAASLSVFRASVNCGSVKRIVYFSSMARYGDAGGRAAPFLESDLATPVDVYGAAKLAAEYSLRALTEMHGIKWCVLVPHNVVGARQALRDPFRNVLAIWVNRLMKNKPPIIYGDGEQRRALSDIRDSLPCYLQVGGLDGQDKLDSDGEVFNIGSGEDMSIAELAEMTIEEFGSDHRPIHAAERPREVKYAYCSTHKSEFTLGFERHHTLRETIRDFIAWAREQGPQDCEYIQRDEIEITRGMPKVWVDEEI